MKVLVCGSRSYMDSAAIFSRLSLLPAGSTVIVGGARGADQIAEMVAYFCDLGVEVFPARWELGRQAGYLRNLQMLDENPDLVIAFWDGKSKGTQHTIDNARKRGITVEIIP